MSKPSRHLLAPAEAPSLPMMGAQVNDRPKATPPAEPLVPPAHAILPSLAIPEEVFVPSLSTLNDSLLDRVRRIKRSKPVEPPASTERFIPSLTTLDDSLIDRVKRAFAKGA